MEKKEKRIRPQHISILIIVMAIIVASTLLIFAASVCDEVLTSTEDMSSSVSAVASSYRQNSEAESKIESSYLKTFQSEVLVINHILSDYDIQNFSDEDRLQAVDSMKEIRSRSASRELYVCDENGKLFLASDKDWIDASLVEKKYFTKEQLQYLTEEASKEENLKDDADPQSIPVELSDSYGYCFCRRILDSLDRPTDYYLIMVYDIETVNEGIDAWIDKTVLADAVSAKNPLTDFFIVENDKVIYSSNEEENIVSLKFTEDNDYASYADSSVLGNWGGLKAIDEEGNEKTYSLAYQEIVERYNGQNYQIIASFDYNEMADGSVYRFGGAVGSATVLITLLVLFVIYCLYALRVMKNKREFLLVSSIICALAVTLFGVISTYFQSLEDITEITVTADQVSTQIQNLQKNQQDRSIVLANDYMDSDMTKLGLVAFDVEYSGKTISDSLSTEVYYEADESGNTVSRKDSLGNDLVCYSGSKILSDKTGILSDADIWVINDQGFAVASSNSSNWYLNTNEKSYSEDIRKVMYNENGSTSIYYTEEDLEEDEENVGSIIIYPVSIYAYTDENGNTAYMSKKDYMSAISKDDYDENAGPKKQMGVLLVRTYEQPEALALTQDSYLNNLETIVTSCGCSYALLEYDDASGTCKNVNEQVIEKDVAMELEQISVPNGIKDSTVFNYFQKISKQNCFVRVTKEVSQGVARAFVFRTDVVHKERRLLVEAYMTIACIAFIIAYVLVLKNAKKQQLWTKKIVSSNENDNNQTTNAAKERFHLFEDTDQGSKESIGKKASIVKLIIYAVILLSVCSIVTDLFYQSAADELGAFVNIYSTDWERCINVYNIGAALLLLVVTVITFNFVKILIELLCVPLGRKVETYAQLVVSVIQYVLIFLGIFYGAYLLGMDIKSIGTFATVIAGVIGIGSQQLISDVGSGVAILSEGRYMIGDLVRVDEFTGVIREMGIRNCIIVNDDLIEKSVSNGKMSDAILLKRNVPIPNSKNNSNTQKDPATDDKQEENEIPQDK